jgi:NADPH:quinone reductase-like Zn-dependent oxidoreductase
MRAFVVERPGAAPHLADLPPPSGEDGALVRVRYAGMNPIDYKVLGRLQEGEAFPHVIGQDFAGVVERAPEWSGLWPGERVFGIARSHGAYAEQTVARLGVRDEPVAPIPEGVSDAQAAALPTPALTALAALEALGVHADMTLVITGAVGAVGGFALQMAKARGARVIAVVKGGIEEALRLAADEAIDVDAQDWVTAVRARHPDGIDAVLDLTSSEEDARRDAQVLHSGGALVSTIHGADEEWFAQRGLRAKNLVMNWTPQSSPSGLETVARMVADGTITVRIGADEELEHAPEVFERFQQHRIAGKVVLHTS